MLGLDWVSERDGVLGFLVFGSGLVGKKMVCGSQWRRRAEGSMGVSGLQKGGLFFGSGMVAGLVGCDGIPVVGLGDGRWRERLDEMGWVRDRWYSC